MLKVFQKFSFLLLICITATLFASCNSERRSGGIACGGPMNSVCPIGLFCKLSEDCGDIDQNGLCAPIPQNCTLTEETICGCDNQEYLNECTANTLSVTKKNEGRCIKSPKIEVTSDND